MIVDDWLLDFEECVRDRDYARARLMFHPHVIGFGTTGVIMLGLDALEAEQWRRTWPMTTDFTFTSARKLSQDYGFMLALTQWKSLRVGGGVRAGRASILLKPRGESWLAVHTHFSLNPGTVD